MADETQRILNSINTANNVNLQKRAELKTTIESHKQKEIQDLAQRNEIAVLERDVQSHSEPMTLLFSILRKVTCKANPTKPISPCLHRPQNRRSVLHHR